MAVSPIGEGIEHANRRADEWRVHGTGIQTYGALIAKEHYDPPGFRLSLLFKDVRLALTAADSAAVPMPMADIVHDSLLEAVATTAIAMWPR
jgi:3-hydroxyisobutyrate dehydrogenase-like beta-hydroxyacid dehydrogenase